MKDKILIDTNNPNVFPVITCGDFTIELDDDLVRIIYKDSKMVKYWFKEDAIQTSLLPNSCDILQDHENIFKNMYK